MSSIRVGFIGLGDIGLPMAKSLAKKGLPLTIYARRKEVVEEMKSLGATAASSCREVAAASDVLISVVRDIPQTEEVIFGKDGVWEGIKEGATIVISSTISSEYCQKLYARAKERGVQVIDAGLSKSGPTNEEGGFTLMVGGDEDAVKRCWPVFEAMAKHIFHLGGIGMGQAYKLVNQLAGISNGIITRECLNLGLKAGLDLQKMLDVIRVSTGNSWRLESLDYMMKARKLRPAAKGPAAKAPRRDLGTKDRDLAIKLAEKVGANIPLLRFIAELDAESAYDAYSAMMRQFD
ncbi:2-hydroxy-3-oxopropionate reductase [subsurface metagenome]